MNYRKFDLGILSSGRAVQITLSGDATNVRLLDVQNMVNYVHGRDYNFTGGVAKKSPVILRVPHPGRWYVVLDMEGLKGDTDASVKILAA
jgi:hypothetical protein